MPSVFGRKEGILRSRSLFLQPTEQGFVNVAFNTDDFLPRILNQIMPEEQTDD